MSKQRNMFQTKGQNKTPEQLSGDEQTNKGFKVIIIKMLSELGKMDEHRSLTKN